MDRRDFIKATGVATAVTLGGVGTAMADVSAPYVARGARRWVLALPQSLDHQVVRTLALRVQHQLESALPGTGLVIETAIEGGLEAVSTGMADLYIGLDTQHRAAHPALPLFAGLPTDTDGLAMAHRAWLAGPGRLAWAAALDAVDVVAMPVLDTGPSPGLYTDTAFETGRDLAGVRIAARGLAADALRILGADASEADADGAGAVAGCGLVASEPLLTPFETKAQWAYPALTPHGLTLSLGMRSSFWRRLSDQERALIEGVAAEARAANDLLNAGREATLRQVANYRQWPIHTAMPAAFERDVRAAGKAAIEALADRDPLARRAIDSLRSFAATTA